MSEAYGLTEGRRQACLAVLGIPLWSSRHALPGALPGARLIFVAQTAAALPTADVPLAPEPEAVPVTAAPVQSPRAAEAAPLRAGAPERPSADAAVQASAGGFPRFSCRVQPLAPGWTGVITLEEDAPDLSAQEYRLLGNLLLALGGDALEGGPREHFRWPMSPNPAIPRDADAAREALTAFLGRRGTSSQWLVLGETLALYVRAAVPGQKVVAAPRLRDLLENPAAKRALWLALHE